MSAPSRDESESVTRAGRAVATVSQSDDGSPVVTAGAWWWGPAGATARLARTERDGARSTPAALLEARDEARTAAALYGLTHGCER